VENTIIAKIKEEWEMGKRRLPSWGALAVEDGEEIRMHGSQKKARNNIEAGGWSKYKSKQRGGSNAARKTHQTRNTSRKAVRTPKRKN